MLTTRRTILAGGAASLALMSGCVQPTNTAASPELAHTLDQIATDYLKLSPEYATSLAVSEEQAGGRYIDKLSDVSKAGFEAGKEFRQNAVNTLSAVNRGTLNHDDQVSLDVVKTAYENDLACLQYEVGTGASTPYVLSQLTGSFTQIPDFLDSQHPITNRDQADAYLARLTAYGRQMDQEVQRVHEDQAAGVIPPDFAIDGALRQLRGFAAQPAARTVLVQSLQRRLADVHEVSAADRAALVRQATSIVNDAVLPAYRRQIAALEGIRANAPHDAGIWRLPHGPEMYAAALKQQTTTNLTPDEVHTMGVDTLRDLTSQMDAILRGQGLTTGTVGERIQAVFRRPDQIFPNTDAGRQQCIDYLNSFVQEVRARMPESFNTLAHAELQIKRVPVYIQDAQPGGYYNGAALDGSRPGTYYINLRDTHEVPKFTLKTLTFHEGIPGHHWQISIQQESHGLPFIRRAILGFNAYAEGWALYSEQLADEMGFYANDQLGRLGYLKDAAFRASRLVVDTGMHAKHWTREQALQSMNEVLGEKIETTATEIERYCVWPGQACGYMVGKKTILRLRDAARQAMGQRFDLKGFHDVVLTNGSTPLTVLETLVSDWSHAPARS